MASLFEILFLALLWVCKGSGATFPQQTYHTEHFVAPDMKITKSGQPTESGYLFFSPTLQNTSPIIMTDNNELVWHGPAHVNAENFRTQTLHNKSVLSYWAGHRYNHPLNNFGHGTGFVIIMDNTYKVAYNICISDDTLTWVTPDPATFPGKIQNPCYLDRHESYITNRGTIIATAYNVTRADLRPLKGPKNGWIFDALFFEIDIATQKILFRWSALENVDFTTSNFVNQAGGNPLDFGGGQHGSTQSKAWDFFHINSVQPVPGGYIVNSRMTWAFYKVDGKTGKVIWTMEGSHGGDFTLARGIFWSWQHMARMHSVDKNSFQVSLFNNDNIRGLVAGKNHSTGYLLDVNTDTMHVTALQNFRDPAQPIFSLAEGSHQILGKSGHSLLGYGAEPFIKEFNKQGDTVYTAQFANKSGFVSAGSHSYRAYRNLWHGFPTQKPRVVASIASGNISDEKVDVYMSWNGATDYDGWTVYAGETPGSLSRISPIAKEGFETHFVLTPGMHKWKYVVAEAGKGTSGIANSTAAKIQS